MNRIEKAVFPIQRIDTRLYVRGFSGEMVYQALYGIVAALLAFVICYIAWGVFPAVGLCVPLIFGWLYRLNRIQKNYGAHGWQKKKVARRLPKFITMKQRIGGHIL